ncbi:MAG: serine/threonine protein kinase, partial [Planctomycetes bacterium]|nr:serine/threonine protein kinase [Planctomycetota bacterium]
FVMQRQARHPSIPRAHELGYDRQEGEEVPYFAMEYVAGPNLIDFCAPLTLRERLPLLIAVCAAVHHAHGRGVVHRDLKPANVILEEGGGPRITDFGLAKDVGASAKGWTVTGQAMGTPAYMPPEQALGQIDRMGPASDVYAMGAVLYHLLSGHMPYVPPGASLSARSIHARVMHGPPEPVSSTKPGIHPELAAICEKAMARDPNARYRDMTELASDLRAFLENRVVQAHGPGLLAGLRKLISRNRVAFATIGVAIGVVALVTSLSMWHLREQRNAARELAAA